MAIYIFWGFLRPWKKRRYMFSEGIAAHPVGCDSTLQIEMSVWCPCFWIWTSWVGHESSLQILMGVCRASNLKKGHQTAISRGMSHQTRSLSRIVCRGQEGTKGSKGTLRPDFQANIKSRIFFKANVTTRNRKTVARNPTIVSLWQFRFNDVWTLLGRRAHWWIRKG